MASQQPPIKLSVKALLVSPLRLRWQALCGLWRYHGCWRIPQIKAALRSELHQELSETIPIVIVLALIAAIMIFVVLPASLREQIETILFTLWPIWVVQAAPMVVAQTLCMLNAPAIALRYSALPSVAALPQTADLQNLHELHMRRIAARAVPQIIAHAWLCAASTCLLVMFTLVFGILAEFVLAVGDLRLVLTTILSSTQPLAWLRSIGQAALLGGVCALCAILFAWPGSQQASSAKDTHRLGVLAMIIASAACAGAGLAMNWIAALLGWNPNAL